MCFVGYFPRAPAKHLRTNPSGRSTSPRSTHWRPWSLPPLATCRRRSAPISPRWPSSSPPGPALRCRVMRRRGKKSLRSYRSPSEGNEVEKRNCLKVWLACPLSLLNLAEGNFLEGRNVAITICSRVYCGLWNLAEGTHIFLLPLYVSAIKHNSFARFYCKSQVKRHYASDMVVPATNLRGRITLFVHFSCVLFSAPWPQIFNLINFFILNKNLIIFFHFYFYF